MLLIFVLEGALMLCMLLSAIRLGVDYYRGLLKQSNRRAVTTEQTGSASPELERLNESKLLETLRITLIQSILETNNERLDPRSLSIRSYNESSHDDD